MNDFLLAAAITGGGLFAMSEFVLTQSMNKQKNYCASQGGTWMGNFDCRKENVPVSITGVQGGIAQVNPLLVYGLPVAAALIATRSISGVGGAAVGLAGAFLIAFSGTSF